MDVLADLLHKCFTHRSLLGSKPESAIAYQKFPKQWQAPVRLSVMDGSGHLKLSNETQVTAEMQITLLIGCMQDQHLLV